MPPPVRSASSASSSSSRARVPAFLLVVAIIAAFAWGLVMFLAGRSSVVPDHTPLDEREQAQAGLLHIDRALDAGDVARAEHLIHNAQMPASPVWTGALALRRHRLEVLRAGPAWQFRSLSPDAQHPGQWLAIGLDHRGDALLSSTDAGAHWREIRRLPNDAALQRAAQMVLVTVCESARLGWFSSDGGNAWQEIPWPGTPVNALDDLHCTILDDGRVVAAVHTTEWQIFAAKPAEPWTPLPLPPGSTAARLIALGALEHDAFLLISAPGSPTRMLASTDTGRTWLEAPAELAVLTDQTCATTVVGEALHVVPLAGKPARFARRDGAFLGFGN